MKRVLISSVLLVASSFIASRALGQDLSVSIDCVYKELRSRGRYIEYQVTCTASGEDSDGNGYYLGKRDPDDGLLKKLKLVVRVDTFQDVATDIVERLQILGGNYRGSPDAPAAKSYSVTTSPVCAGISSTQVSETYEARLEGPDGPLVPHKKAAWTLTHPSNGFAGLICNDHTGLLRMINGKRLYRLDQFEG